jgi:two-component system, NarL family, response regulator LiaR
MADPIQLLIVDDHTVVRQGLCALIDEEPSLHVIGQATDGEEAVEKAHTLHPDVILLDLAMPRKDGLQAIREIMAENGEARILVLSNFSDNQIVIQAIKAGASGYLHKSSSAEELLAAIHAVYRGESSLSPAIARILVNEINAVPSQSTVLPEALSRRETDVLDLIAKGLSNQEIANTLSLSERTVSAHVSSVLRKLHLASRTQAALYALQLEKIKKSG